MVKINFRSLKLKILVPVLSIALIGFMAIAVSGYVRSRNIILKDIEEISEGKVQNIVTLIDGKLNVWKTEVEMLAASNIVREPDFDKFKKYISDRSSIFDGYEMFLVSDSSGAYKATTGSDGNISDREYFSRAMKGEVVVSEPVVSRATGKPIIVIAAPIKAASGGFEGVVAGTMELHYLSDIVDGEKFGKSGYAYMTDKKGLVMTHPVKEKIFTENLLENQNSSLKGIVEKMIKGETGVDHYTYEGVKKIVGYSFVKATGWPIAMTIEYAEATKDVDSLRNSIVFIGLTSLVLMLVIVTLIVSRLIKPVLSMAETTKLVAQGDLTVEVNVASTDEIGLLARNFNDMVTKTRNIILDMKDIGATVAASSEEMMASSEEVSKVSEQIAVAIGELAKGATEQAISTEKGNNGIREVVEGLSQINEEMRNSEQLTEKALVTVSAGEKSVQMQEDKMSENKKVSENVNLAILSLSDKSKEIGQIIEVIKGIADQTNLLSLNAAIEAARAGEQGRGFAVVAEEVRKLAEQSAMSVKKIGEIIKEVQSGVELAVDQMNKAQVVAEDQEKALSETVKSFNEISRVMADISLKVKTVSKASDDLSKNAIQAGEAISDIASIAQESAAGTQEVSASTEEQTSVMNQIADSAEDLAHLANKLQQSIHQFKV